MKIDECLAELESAELALESAPEKGFVDLDKIKTTLISTKKLLQKISPRLQLGEKLIKDTRNSLLYRLNVLKNSGGGALVSQAEDYLNSENLEYDKLKTLQQEINESINAIFGGFSLAGRVKQKVNVNDKIDPPTKIEDYRS